MHITHRRPCAAAALTLMGLAFAMSSAHAQSSSFSALATPDLFMSLQRDQWYVTSQLLVATAASRTAQQSSTLSTLPDGTDEAVASLGPLNTSASIEETGGSIRSQVSGDFSRMSAQVTNQQDAAVAGESMGLSFSVTSYSFYSSAPGPVTFTATLDGRLTAPQARDAFGLVFLSNALAPSTQGLEAVADSVGIDLDLEEMDLVQNIRNATPTIDVRTADVTLRKDSGLPGGVNVFDSSFSLVSQGQLIDCGGEMTLPVCGSYEHAIFLGMMVATANDASAQYSLSVSSVQTPTAVPEPGTVALGFTGLAGLTIWRRRTVRTAGKA